MGGAFVGVADDASAIYWNPAGLAAGSYFSLVVDGGAGERDSRRLPGGQQRVRLDHRRWRCRHSGLGYYRLRVDPSSSHRQACSLQTEARRAETSQQWPSFGSTR